MTYRDVHEDLKRAQAEVLIREQNPTLHDHVLKLRSAILDGLCDHIVLPEISTHNGMAAHDLLGCPLYTGLLQIINGSAQMPQPVAEAVRKVVVEAVTGMSTRLITEGMQVLVEEYGNDHVHEGS